METKKERPSYICKSCNFTTMRKCNYEKHILTRKHKKEQEKEICEKCGIIQGTTNKGVKRYYCGHISARIDQRLKKESKKIFNKVCMFTVSSTCQKDL